MFHVVMKDTKTMSKFCLELKVTSATKRELLEMCHLRHKLRIFLFRRKIMFRFQDIQFFYIFNHPMIYRICGVTMSIST